MKPFKYSEIIPNFIQFLEPNSFHCGFENGDLRVTSDFRDNYVTARLSISQVYAVKSTTLYYNIFHTVFCLSEIYAKF
jgi:hypothetical protein